MLNLPIDETEQLGALNEAVVYVAKRGEAYKIGFTRSVAQRVKRLKASLILTIPARQYASQLERLIHARFANKRLQVNSEREWFALDAQDIEWLSGLESEFYTHLASVTDKSARKESADLGVGIRIPRGRPKAGIVVQCCRCSFSWYAETEGPPQCPQCHDPFWWRPRVYSVRSDRRSKYDQRTVVLLKKI